MTEVIIFQCPKCNDVVIVEDNFRRGACYCGSSECITSGDSVSWPGKYKALGCRAKRWDSEELLRKKE